MINICKLQKKNSLINEHAKF